MRRALFLIWFAAQSAACASPPSSSTHNGVLNDGGMCVRSLEQLTELLVHPQSCVSTATCPSGSFCNSSTGACDWQCYADSDCGLGGTCDCDGRCLSADAGTDTPSDPTCARDEDLLNTIAATPRACAFDDECPHGSRCDATSRTCAWDCLSTDSATDGCAGGAECDCFGRCIAPSAPPLPSVDDTPRLHLEVAPSTMPVTFASPATTWAARRIDLALTTENATLAGAPASAATVVTVTAGPGVEVTCNPAGMTTGPYAASCTVTSWTFPGTPQGTVFRAPKFAWVRPTAPLTGTQWAVTVSSEGVAASPQAQTITLVGAPGSPTITMQGEYEGQVTLTGVTDTQFTATPEGAPTVGLTLPVRAWVLPGSAPDGSDATVYLHDPAGVLSPYGSLKLWSFAAAIYQYLSPTLDGAYDATGSLNAMATVLTRSYTAASGQFHGTFKLLLPLGAQNWHSTTYYFSFELERRKDTVACPANPCAEGWSCLGGICQQGSDNPGGSNVNTLVHVPSTAWNGALATLADRTIGVAGTAGSGRPDMYLPANIYDQNKGFASTVTSSHDQILASPQLAARYNTDEGFAWCNSFDNYLQQIDTNWGGGVVGILDTGTLVQWWMAGEICNRLYSATSGPGGALNATWKQNYAPCVDANPITPPNNGLLASWGNMGPYRATCQRVHENWKLAQDPAPSPVSTTYTTFLSAKCQAVTERVQFAASWGGGSMFDKHAIYLCPFKEPALASYGAAAVAERAMCYTDAAAPAGTLALSLTSRLGTTNLTYSGEPVCTNGVLPHGVDLVTRQDRLDALGLADDDNLVARCLDDLAAVPPVMNTADLPASWIAQFAAHDCFSPGVYYHALGALNDALSETQSANSLDPKISKLLGRLVGQWLALHSYMARESQEKGPLAAVLQYDSDPALQDEATATPTLDELMDRELQGWTLVLAVSTSSKVLGIPDAQALTPDYRAMAGLPYHEQAIGLPALLFEAAAAHMELTDRWLDQAAEDAFAECTDGTGLEVRTAALARTSAALRWTLGAEALAIAMWEQDTTTMCPCTAPLVCGAEGRCEAAGTTSWARPTVAWQNRYTAARDRFAAARQHVVDEAAKLENCEIPMALAPGEVPLYFGDPTGDSSRFFASSDYLLNGWAIPAVEAARGALNEARTAWVEKHNSELQQQMSNLDTDRRIEALATQYGRPFVDMCGLVDVEARDALAMFTSGALDPATCYVNTADPICTVNPATTYAWITAVEPIKFELCYWKELFVASGATTGWQVTMANAWSSATANTFPGPTSITAGGITKTIQQFYASAIFMRARESAADGQRALARCAALSGGVQYRLPEKQDGDPHIADRADCYSGQLGEAMLAIAGAQKNVDIAVSSWRDAQERYDHKMHYCIELQAALGDITFLTQKHREYMDAQQAARDKATRYGNAFSALSAGLSALTNGPSGLAAEVATMYSQDAAEFAAAMETAQRAYDAQMVVRNNAITTAACFAEADQYAIGISTAAMQIDAQLIVAQQQAKRLENMQREMAQLMVEGPAAIAREQGRTVTDLAFHYWLDERVDRYTRDFGWAKQLTYLAMRASEYEFQQSFGLTADVMGATHPDQLEAVIQGMQQQTLTRTINGKRPEDSILVLSLRDEILRLQDNSAADEGERDWSPALRFQHRLWSPEYAVYDDTGNYLGQGIPFSLAEQGALNNRCAERMWRVTATIQGDLLDEDAPAAPVFLVKQNSFESQWCEGRGDGTDHQVGAMPPTSHLFHPEDRGGSEAAGITHTTAMLMPWFNVRRSDLYREGYEEGASDELAGRGLYGDYVLLFPWDGLLDHGFPLEQVEDVLIRFDYLSVDDLPL